MGNVKLLKASAGSGKTYQLAYEYVRSVISEPWQYRHILAVTFTNKATEEMKRRIIYEINELAQGISTNYLGKLIDDLNLAHEIIQQRALSARTKILHDYSHFSILTIDKFFQRIIRSFIKELGIDLNFNLELQTGTILSVAADRLIDEISLNDKLKNWITDFVEEKIGENRKWEVKTELIELGREIFRENYKRSTATGVSKNELTAIVSTASAESVKIINSLKSTAQKALDIISSNNLYVSDFSGGTRSFANYFVKTANGDITPPGVSVLAAIDSDEKWYAKTSSQKDNIISILPELRTLLQELVNGYEKNHRFLNSIELLRRNYRNFALLADLAEKIEIICASENILPISETNNILNKLISGNDTPFIFEKTGNHFTRFMIDEFQDTSAMQWENFLPLLHNAVAQSEETPVLLVGDIKQSIYRWRGGDWRILGGEIEKEFGSLVTIDLTTNYRSLGRIVEFNNNIIGECVASDNGRLNTELEDAAQQKLISSSLKDKLRDTLNSAYRNHCQKSIDKEGVGYINITVYEKQEGEDDQTPISIPPVVRHIENLQDRGYSAGDIAILVRNGADGIKIANLLLERKAKNPESKYSYEVITQEALLIDSAPVINFVIACFKLATMPSETINRAIYNKWHGRDLPHDLPVEDMEFLARLRLMSPEDAFESIISKYELNSRQSDIAYLQAFHEQILSFTTKSISDIRLFVKWWDENGGTISVNIPRGESAITISTIHKSKGLEYKAVIIPYCNWNLNPMSRSILWADGSKAAAGLTAIPIEFSDKMKNSLMAEDYYKELVMSHVDNLNIFYVATTRAMEELYIMMPADKKRREDRINTLILDSININGDDVNIGAIAGKYSRMEGNEIYEFGKPLMKNSKTVTENEKIYSAFRSFRIENRLKLKTRTERYFDSDNETSTLSPRNYGILMHQVFEKAVTFTDIEQTVKEMELSGQLSAAETDQLNNVIAKALKNKLINSWFDGNWEVVRSENDIIVPLSSSPRRPDRVMIKGNKAVILDYKFGLHRPASHRKQIAGYADLLRQMGHSEIEGYIWYVSLDDIEKVL